MKNLAVYGLILIALLLGACGSDTDDKDKQSSTTSEVKQDKSDAKESNKKKENKEDERILNPFVAEDLNADVEVVFTNKKPDLKHEFSKDVSIQIDEYQIMHVSNMNESAKSNFDDEDEGYVLTYKMTLVNNSDEDVYYYGGVSLLSDDGMDNIIQRRHLVDREQWLKDDSTKDFSCYSKGKTFTGMNAYSMTKEQYKKLSSPTLTIDAVYLNNDVSQVLGEDAIFKIPFNEEGVKKAEASSKLYQDRMTTDNIAEKKLFFEKTDINKTKEIDGVKITLNGVQYANVKPTEAYKESFSNFGDSGVVALTAKITVENGSDTPLDKSFVDRKLIVDKNRGIAYSEGSLEPRKRGTINPGEKDEFITVFLFRKDEFGIYKKLELQVGPLRDSNAKSLFKEKSVTFDLPMKK